MKKILPLLSVLLLTSSCFKTAEEIRREKMIDQMNLQLEQSSKVIAQLTQRVKSLQGRLDTTSGQLEEIGYKTTTSQEETQNTFSQTTAQLAEQINILKTDVKENKNTLMSINNNLKSQQEYLNKLNSTLAKITGVSSSTKSSSNDLLKQAHSAFEKNNQKEAKSLYEEVLSTGQINAAQKNHIWYNLGLLDHWSKKFNDSNIWFSKIYTNYPKSSWARRALLYIARNFKSLGKKEESIATYNQVIESYPKSPQAKIAKKEIVK